jgi:hypothetical protein
MRDHLTAGWRLGGVALGFVLGHRVLQRFILSAIVIVLAISVVVAVTAVALRREAGPVGYVLVGLAAYYCLSVMVTAVAVGVAGLTAESLESRPVSFSTGWRVIRCRRRSIAGWALVDVVAGLPSRAIGTWSVDQLAVLLIGFGWGLVSFFAIPTIALTGASPLATARQSLRLVRRRWGDAVYSTVYLWVRAVVVFGLPAAAATIAGVLLIRGDRVIIGGALFAAGVAGLALAHLLTQAARSVLTVALYQYAESGKVYDAFPSELLEHALRGPSSFVRRLAQRIDGDRIRRLRRRVFGDIDEPPS